MVEGLVQAKGDEAAEGSGGGQGQQSRQWAHTGRVAIGVEGGARGVRHRGNAPVLAAPGNLNECDQRRLNRQ
jgi:hypothetical protein